MRILIMSPSVPYPLTSGFAIRTFQFLTLLGRRHDVSLLAYAERDESESIASLRPVCANVRGVQRPAAMTSAKRVGQFASMLWSRSYQTTSHTSARMQTALDEMNAKSEFDIIQVETSAMAGFRFPGTAARALVEHDIIFELLYRMYETEQSPLRRLYNRVEYVKFRRDEIEAWRRADACVVTSARETPIIHRHVPDVPVFVAPNGVDVTYFAPSNEPVDPDVIVMTGFMKTRPNIDGAIHFVQAILPLILKSRPSARFYIVGGSPPDEVRALTGPNVVVTGDVPDVRPYARMAAVVVVPLRIGGGTRLKILEGLAMEKPMVSTTLGAEGIDIRHGEHLLIADDPMKFARSVLDLMEKPALGQSLAAAGRELVDRTYQWRVISDRLEEFYEGLVRSDRRRAGSCAPQ